MTKEQINIAIAESLGWKKNMGDWYRPNANCQYITRSKSDGGYTIYPPNYYNDLNAMHEVWCSLTEKQHQYFRRELQFVIAEAGDNNIPHKGPCHSVCNATALQRAEAYLRTIGKWNEKD